MCRFAVGLELDVPARIVTSSGVVPSLIARRPRCRSCAAALTTGWLEEAAKRRRRPSWQDLNMIEIPARLSIVTLGARDMGVLRSFYRKLGWPELPIGDD